MKARCLNPKDPYYQRYGGRGIKILWKNFRDFSNDMKCNYSEGLTLDRINNNGHYSKENCKWSTLKEQARNRNTNRIIEYGGQRKTIAEWAELSKIKPSTFRQRFYTYGWSLDRCLNYKF